MEKSITPTGVVPAAVVDKAWQQVAASFDRFCLAAGVAALADMMEQDAARLCGVRYGRTEGVARGGPRGSLASTGARSNWRGLASVPATAARSGCRAGKQPWPRIGSASGR